MKYLLDTHTFIWSIAQSTLIPEQTRQAIHRNLTMVSRDAEFKKFVPHGLRLLWQ